MPGQHVHNFAFLRFTLNRELDEFYISIVTRFFALSMIGLFVPLYLYRELGLSLQRIALFYIVFAIFFAFAAVFAGKLVSRIGVTHTILASIPISIFF
ncbi:MAG: hypothetical protein AABX59_03830, partial [Nanoarchaeota archaeon]